MADPLIGFTMDLSDIQQVRGKDDVVARGGLGSQCFPIAELNNDWDGVPQDGMEYLFTVRSVACAHKAIRSTVQEREGERDTEQLI